MAIAQDAFFIPDDIATGLATGLYRRIGSVVRYAIGPNKGQIVKHLKPIDLKAAEQAQGLGAKALQFAQQHKKGITITVVCAAVVGASWWGYTQWKNHEPEVLTNFRVALKSYIEAIRNGNMDISKINALMKELKALKQHKHYEKISIQLTAEDLEILVGRIYEYIGNSDMHLKNFSLIETAEGNSVYQLSDAYDMLPVNVIMPQDKEQLALTLNGKKQNIRRKDFLIFAEACGLNSKSAEKMIEKIVSLKDTYIGMCRESYLPDDMKESFEALICDRISVLS